MYSKEERSRLQQEFWTTLGKYLSPIPSAEGEKINWINYKTGIKNLRFFMDADTKLASVGIKLLHPEPLMQELFFDEFLKLKIQFMSFTNEEFDWQLHVQDSNGANVSLISKSIVGVNVLDKDHWPQLISFFKPRMLALDAFWCNWKYNFEDLAS